MRLSSNEKAANEKAANEKAANEKAANEKPSNGLSPESIAPFLVNIAAEPVIVAFSGGVDSTVLLHLLASCRSQGSLQTLRAVHIHHGLSDLADSWQAFCQSFCHSLNIPLTVARVELSGTSGGGIEQEARQARYQIFEEVLNDGGSLLMGHHQDDQAETLLLRLFRGTGLEGLQGIPGRRALGKGQILRPLLNVSRAGIEDYARRHQLQWIEDDSNVDEAFSRNFLRHQIIPGIEQRWPGASRRMAELTKDVTAVNARLSGLSEQLLQQAQTTIPQWLLGNQPLLSIEVLQSFDVGDQRQVIRLWLKKQGFNMPGRQALETVIQELMDARSDAEPVIRNSQYCLRRFRGYLVADVINTDIDYQPLSWDWRSNPELILPDGKTLSILISDSRDKLALNMPDKPLQVLWRRHIDTSQKVAVAGRSGRKTIKRWLQEYNIPPWLRDQVPFIFMDDLLVTVPGLWLCEGFQTDSRGQEITWW